MIEVPQEFLNVPYNGEVIPLPLQALDLTAGANCQVFAYALLEHFGILVPHLRSSNLWDDVVHTRHTPDLEPLDILFFNSTWNPWGAHLGVSLGGGRVIHLSKQVGLPVVWEQAEFADHARYACFLGAKRCIFFCDGSLRGQSQP